METYQRNKIMELIGKAIEKHLTEESLIIFYGSLVKGGFGRTSDIDVALFSKEGLSAKALHEIELSLEEISLLRTIEVVDLGRTKNPLFIEEVLSEGVIWKSSREALSALKRRIQSLRKSKKTLFSQRP
jgi:predicted nucleotidyltransferase